MMLFLGILLVLIAVGCAVASALCFSNNAENPGIGLAVLALVCLGVSYSPWQTYFQDKTAGCMATINDIPVGIYTVVRQGTDPINQKVVILRDKNGQLRNCVVDKFLPDPLVVTGSAVRRTSWWGGLPIRFEPIVDNLAQQGTE